MTKDYYKLADCQLGEKPGDPLASTYQIGNPSNEPNTSTVNTIFDRSETPDSLPATMYYWDGKSPQPTEKIIHLPPLPANITNNLQDATMLTTAENHSTTTFSDGTDQDNNSLDELLSAAMLVDNSVSTNSYSQYDEEFFSTANLIHDATSISPQPTATTNLPPFDHTVAIQDPSYYYDARPITLNHISQDVKWLYDPAIGTYNPLFSTSPSSNIALMLSQSQPMPLMTTLPQLLQ